MSKETEKLVNKYLDELKKNLPEWIKSNDEKVKDILLEISSHIWDSAYEIAGSDDPDTISIQKAINNIGNPKEIAKSYKTRGTPKFWISEELWSQYTKVVFSIIAIILTIIMIAQLVIFEPNNLIQAVINGITLSYSSITLFVIIVTVIFVFFSTEGYLPGDFDTKSKSNKSIENEYYKPGEFFGSGIVAILFGLFFILLPIELINIFRIIIFWILGLFNNPMTYSEITILPLELQIFFTLLGIVSVITGVIHLMKIQTKDMGNHLVMNGAFILAKIGDAILSVYVLLNLHLFLEIIPIPELIYGILMILAIIAAITEISKTISINIKLYEYLEAKNNSVAI